MQNLKAVEKKLKLNHKKKIAYQSICTEKCCCVWLLLPLSPCRWVNENWYFWNTVQVKVIVSYLHLYIYLANSLKCYECRDVNSCKNPTTVQCDQVNANATRDALLNTYHNVQITNTTKYACYVGIYTAGKLVFFLKFWIDSFLRIFKKL